MTSHPNRSKGAAEKWVNCRPTLILLTPINFGSSVYGNDPIRTVSAVSKAFDTLVASILALRHIVSYSGAYFLLDESLPVYPLRSRDTERGCPVSSMGPGQSQIQRGFDYRIGRRFLGKQGQVENALNAFLARPVAGEPRFESHG